MIKSGTGRQLQREWADPSRNRSVTQWAAKDRKLLEFASRRRKLFKPFIEAGQSGATCQPEMPSASVREILRIFACGEAGGLLCERARGRDTMATRAGCNRASATLCGCGRQSEKPATESLPFSQSAEGGEQGVQPRCCEPATTTVTGGTRPLKKPVVFPPLQAQARPHVPGNPYTRKPIKTVNPRQTDDKTRNLCSADLFRNTRRETPF